MIHLHEFELKVNDYNPLFYLGYKKLGTEILIRVFIITLSCSFCFSKKTRSLWLWREEKLITSRESDNILKINWSDLVMVLNPNHSLKNQLSSCSYGWNYIFIFYLPLVQWRKFKMGFLKRLNGNWVVFAFGLREWKLLLNLNLLSDWQKLVIRIYSKSKEVISSFLLIRRLCQDASEKQCGIRKAKELSFDWWTECAIFSLVTFLFLGSSRCPSAVIVLRCLNCPAFESLELSILFFWLGDILHVAVPSGVLRNPYQIGKMKF